MHRARANNIELAPIRFAVGSVLLVSGIPDNNRVELMSCDATTFSKLSAANSKHA
jgi:hypothetical protein